MQAHSDFFESLYKRGYSAPDNIEFLQKMAEKYPFFAPTQFYLLAQTKTDTPEHDSYAAKAAILFNNEFWLNYQLEQTLKVEVAKPQPEVLPIKEELVMDQEAEVNNTDPVAFQPYSTATEEAAPTPPAPLPVFTIQPTNDKEEGGPVVFQPLYMTDYFASQGIKLSEEVLPTDKLGVQLKSFTEWLKTMKKVHSERLPQVDVHTDEKIQSLAEQSNNGGDVVTEAMAEVLVQQGLTKKAIEVYEKLSLLSPAKSVYFAAKITQLKES